MYTIDDEKKEDLYEDDDYEISKWDNIKGLIFKIIIIVLCVIVLIWLIKALKNKNNQVDNTETHIANVEKVRLAAEDYFFIKDNKKKTSYVTVEGLKNAGLIDDVVDANKKVCSDTASKVNLENESDDYKMTVKLSCSTNDKDEVFYYSKNDLACLNCSGKTYMDGKTVVIDDNKKEDNSKNNTKDDEAIDIVYYSCKDWSDWSKERVYEIDLQERTKTLVQGVKRGNRIVYGEWSDYTTTPISQTAGIEVESKVITETLWSDPITSSEVDTSNSNIHIISTETITNGGSNCSNGYVDNGICYSNKVTVGNLTFKEFMSGNYKIKNNYCEGVSTLPNKDGLYVLTYVNCQYNEKIGKASSGYTYTLYTYQELETHDITYYRYRTVSTVSEADVYTNTKYEEKDLPAGYEKVPGSEETYYSYKLITCEK